MTSGALDLERLMLIPPDGKAAPAHPAFRAAIRKALREGWKWPQSTRRAFAVGGYVLVEEEERGRLGLRFSRFGTENVLWLPTVSGSRSMKPSKKGDRFLRVLSSEDLPEHSSLRPRLGQMVFESPNAAGDPPRGVHRVRWRCLEHEDCAGNIELGVACELAKPKPKPKSPGRRGGAL